ALPVPLSDPAAVDLKTLRVAYYTDNGIVSCTPEVIATVMKAVDALRDAGVKVIEEARPPEIENTLDLYIKISGASGAEAARQHLKALGTERVTEYFQYSIDGMEKRGTMSAPELMDLTS